MSQKFLFLLFLIIGLKMGFSQQELSETDKLAVTAKIWGFLKYYHPNVANGMFNWDEQLFTTLPKVEKANSKEALSTVFIDWIKSLGKIKPCKSCKKDKSTEYFDKNFNLSWTQDSTQFSKELSEKLKFIEDNRRQGKQHYVSQGKRAQNIIIQNERSYENFSWEDKNLRLLSLFRYWNTIAYFFPYKYQTDQPWAKVLSEMIPRFTDPKSELDYHLAMLELVVKIDDSHAGLTSDVLEEHFGAKHIPGIFQIIDEKAVIVKLYNDSLARVNDLQIGDAITKIDGKKVSSILIENKKYTQGSNLIAKRAFSWNKVFNGSTDSVEIEFLRNKEPITKTIGRYPFEDFKYKRPQKEKWKILKNDIGYVNMGEVDHDDVDTIMDTLMSAKAIIFDIRNYPKGTMYSIANYLNASQKEFVKVAEPDLSYPGRFKWKKPLSSGGSGKIEEHYKGKVVLLVNSRTISHAEFTAMCLQTAKNSITVGSQTLAADGNVSELDFVGGFKTRFSGIGIFYPNGTETQRVGIRIDMEVEPTIKGIQEGKDEVLEKDLEIANN